MINARHKKISVLTGIAALAASLAMAGPAFATIVPITFITGTNGNTNQSASATFTFTTNSFTLALDNTSSIDAITSVLDGFGFNQTGMTNIMLTGITSPDGVVTCTATTSKTGSCSDTSPGSQPTSDWTITASGGSVGMDAGTGLHPYGIVNDTIDTWVANNGKSGGLTNGQHNPYLEGPVSFTFSYSADSSPLSISNVSFLFGTGPDVICAQGSTCSPPVSTPEPGALAIFAAGLLGCALFINRRRRAAGRS